MQHLHLLIGLQAKVERLFFYCEKANVPHVNHIFQRFPFEYRNGHGKIVLILQTYRLAPQNGKKPSLCSALLLHFTMNGCGCKGGSDSKSSCREETPNALGKHFFCTGHYTNEACTLQSIKGGIVMATREAVENCINRCEQAVQSAREQFAEGNRQENYGYYDFSEPLTELEEAYNELCKLAISANSQQRERLHRMRLVIQQLQNEMILQEHEPTM